jgi:hypothetical protein
VKPSIAIAVLASLAAALTALKVRRQDKTAAAKASCQRAASEIVIDLPEATELDIVYLKKYPQSMSEMAVWLS